MISYAEGAAADMCTPCCRGQSSRRQGCRRRPRRKSCSQRQHSRTASLRLDSGSTRLEGAGRTCLSSPRQGSQEIRHRYFHQTPRNSTACPHSSGRSTRLEGCRSLNIRLGCSQGCRYRNHPSYQRSSTAFPPGSTRQCPAQPNKRNT